MDQAFCLLLPQQSLILHLMAQLLVFKTIYFFLFEIIYIYKESKNSTENSHLHHFSDAKILCNHSTFVKTKNLALGIYCLGFPGGSDGKESACNLGDLGLIPEQGRFPWRREWLPTPVSLPGKSHGQRSLGAIVHGVTKSWT